MNDPIFKSSNARGLPGGGGMLKFQFDRRIKFIEEEVDGRTLLESKRLEEDSTLEYLSIKTTGRKGGHGPETTFEW